MRLVVIVYESIRGSQLVKFVFVECVDSLSTLGIFFFFFFLGQYYELMQLSTLVICWEFVHEFVRFYF